MEPEVRLTHEQLRDLAELAPLRGLDPEEHRRVADHLAEGCDECAGRYARGLDALEVIGATVALLPPSPGRRDALLAAAEPATVAPIAAPRKRWHLAIPALAAAIALVLAAGSLHTARRAEQRAVSGVRLARAQVDARLAERERDIESLAARLARFEHAVEVDEARVRELPLSGEASFVNASARVVVDRAGNQVLLLASELPPAPEGHTYQLWVIVSGAPRSLGVFDADAGGRALFVESGPLELNEDFSVAVSVEPAGGVPQPTGPIVLVSH